MYRVTWYFRDVDQLGFTISIQQFYEDFATLEGAEHHIKYMTLGNGKITKI